MGERAGLDVHHDGRQFEPTHDASGRAADGDAWLAQLANANAGNVSPAGIARALASCHSAALRHAVLRAVAARWGNSGVQQTLAAERELGAAGTSKPEEAEAATRPAPNLVKPARPHAGDVTEHASPVGATGMTAPAQALTEAAHSSPTATARARVLAQLGRGHLAAIERALLPAYRRAVAATDTASVRALVMQIVGGVAHAVNAQGQISMLVPQVDDSPHAAHASTAATDPYEPDPTSLSSLIAEKAALDAALRTSLRQLATEVSPQTFGAHATATATEPIADTNVFERFVFEADLVVSLLAEADEIEAAAMPTDPAQGTSEPASDAARAQALDRIGRWRSRPINFLFLVRVLTARGVWQNLQGVKDLRGESAAELARKVSAQAAETGTTADVGHWDAEEARSALAEDRPELFVTDDDAMAIFENIASAEPRARADLVKQLHRMGLLSRMCTQLPWGLVKDLWEAIDDKEASALLEPYWADRGDGKSLGQMLDQHWYTRPLNTAMDITTLGAKPRIDAAYEAREAGLISNDAYWHSVDKAIGRAAFVGAAMAATGGVAGSFAAGAAGGLGASGAALVSGAAAGAVGSVGGHLAGDLYDQALDGKEGFDSLAEYARSFAEGGAMGAVGAQLGLAAAKYLPAGMQTMAQQAATAHPELTRILEAVRTSGVGVASRVQMTVREFLSTWRGGGPPGFRLAYAGGAIPSHIATASPEALVTLTVRPLRDLNAPAGLRREGSHEELVEVEDVSIAEQVRQEFADADRGFSDRQTHAPDEDGGFASETSRLGEGTPEAQAIQTRRSARDAGVVPIEGQQLSDLHHVFPQEHRAWFAGRGIDIDDWCIEIPVAEHQAQHGGGDWRLARRVAANSPEVDISGLVMKALREQEAYVRTLHGAHKRLSKAAIVETTLEVLESRGLSREFRRYR